jgi:hypothetical protein
MIKDRRNDYRLAASVPYKEVLANFGFTAKMGRVTASGFAVRKEQE